MIGSEAWGIVYKAFYYALLVSYDLPDLALVFGLDDLPLGIVLHDINPAGHLVISI